MSIEEQQVPFALVLEPHRFFWDLVCWADLQEAGRWEQGLGMHFLVFNNVAVQFLRDGSFRASAQLELDPPSAARRELHTNCPESVLFFVQKYRMR